MHRFKLIIVPSSNDEDTFENVSTFKEAQDILDDETIETESAQTLSFATELEMNCFLQGYHAAIGYTGDGLNFKSYS